MLLGISYPITKSVYLLGETRWAMGGDYGAYTEGLIGMPKPMYTYKKRCFNLPVQIVLAGGVRTMSGRE